MIDSPFLWSSTCGIGQCPDPFVTTLTAGPLIRLIPVCARHRAAALRARFLLVEEGLHPARDPWPVRDRYLATCHEVGDEPDPWW